MKKLLPSLLLIMLFCNPAGVKAQWVTIPTNFANYIKTYITAAAISGNQLDTTNTTILTTVDMTITDYSATDITGIQYFKGLQNLVVYPQITSFPQLPSNLNSFEADQSSAATFSAPLPANLFALKIFYNTNLSALPTLPSTLGILILTYDGISSLPALPAGLTWLSVSNCPNLTSIPPIPATVYHLDLSYDPLLTLPALPQAMSYLNLSQSTFGPLVGFQATLDTFICSYCTNITSLPNVPSNLVYLDLDHCNINSTDTMPTGMLDLILTANPVATIPHLPDTIYETLVLDSMPNLTSVGADSLWVGISISMNVTPQIANSNGGSLPNFIQNAHNASIYTNSLSIYANNDNISYIGQFNAYIYNLDLSYNQLTDIGYQNTIASYYAPNCTNCAPLNYSDSINFANNQLTSIDQGFFSYETNYSQCLNFNNNNFGFVSYVPSQTNTLLMNNCQITGFDPSIAISANYLDLGNNSALYCLPYLNGTVQSLITSGDPATCVPDIPVYNFYSDQGLTVCQQGNTYGCPTSPVAGGIVFNDTNQNGYQDAGEGPLTGVYVEMQPGNFIHISDTTGHYLFQCQPQVSYNITGLPTLPYRRVTTNPYYEYLTTLQSDTFDNIGIYTEPDVNDMEVLLFSYELPRPGFHQDYNVTAWNVGTTTENGKVVMYFNSTLSYQSSTPAGTVSGNSVTWDINNMAAGTQFNAYVDFIVPVPVPLGTPVSAGLHAYCNTPDSTPANNSDTITGIAYGSYDPNSKTVSPAGPLAVEQIAAGGYLTYTVRFQNTGTGSAVNIVVMDTLDPGLDVSTFQFITASNKFTWSIDSGVLTVTFNNINLPDSAQSEPGSHGFFAYRIKALPSATPGQQIQNSASIYFDFNAPVATNTDTTGIITFFPIQPQPQVLCKGEPLLLTTSVTNNATSLMWYKNGVATGITADTFSIANPTTANSGNYYVMILAGNGQYYKSHTAEVNIVTDTTPSPTFNISPDGTVHSCKNAASGVPYTITNLSTVITNPVFNWYLNDSLLSSGSSRSFYFAHTFKNGDRFACYAQAGACQNQALMKGDSIVYSFNTADTLHLIVTPATPHICSGENIILTVQATNPQEQGNIFSWFQNGSYVQGGNSNTFSLNAITANTTIVVQMDTSGICPVVLSRNGNYLANDTVQLLVSDTGTPPVGAVNVNYTAPFCDNANNIFAAQDTNLGSVPVFQWLVNGILYGTTYSPQFTLSGVADGEILQCEVLRDICGVADTVYSNQLVLGPDSALIPAVKIVVTNPGSCTTQADFQLQPVNYAYGGYNAEYYIYQNGTYLENGRFSSQNLTINRSPNGKPDTILAVMYSGLPCYYFDSATVILPPPAATVPLYIYNPQPDTLCAGTSQYFYLYSTAGMVWYRNGLPVDSGTGSIYYYSNNDTADFSLYVLTKPTVCAVAQSSDTLHIHYIHTVSTPYLQLTPDVSVFCPGTRPVFTANTNVPVNDIDWYLNGNGVSYGNATYTTYATNGDKLVVTVNTNGNRCFSGPSSISDTLIINVTTQAAEVLLDTSQAVLCGANQGQTFIAQPLYGGSYPGYEWFLNDSLVSASGATFTDTHMAPGDWVYCVMTSDNPCATGVTVHSDTLTLYQGSPLTPSVDINTASAVCSGTPVSFTATGTNTGNSPDYQWQVNGVNTGSDSVVFTTTTLADNDVVSCILTSSLGCLTTPTAVSNTDVVTIYPMPSVPVVITHGDTFTCTAAYYNYQWYKNNAILAGATGQTLITSEAGYYYVIVSNSEGCGNQSAGFVFNVNGIEPVATQNMKAQLFPNPNNGSFILVIDNDELYDVEITDLLGREIMAPSKVARKQVFSLTNAAAGIYVVSIIQNQQPVQRIKFSLVR